MNRLAAFEELINDATAPIIDLKDAHAERIMFERDSLSRTSTSDISLFGRLTIKAGLGVTALGIVGETIPLDQLEKPSLLAIGIGVGGVAVGAAVALHEKLTT